MIVRFVLMFIVASSLNAGAALLPTFQARHDYYPNYGQELVADINGDGIPDIVSWGVPIQTLLGNGDGTFRIGPTSNIGTTAILFAIAVDLNGDGIPDLVMSEGSTNEKFGLAISFGNGDGTFQPTVVYYTGTDIFIGGVAVGDFNNDGILDAVIPGDQGVWLFTGKGGGIFNPAVLTPCSGIGGADIYTADFNGDGNADVIMQFVLGGSDTSAGFFVAFGNGNGTFQAPVQYDPGPPYTVHRIAVGDINGDGFPDVAVSTEANNKVYIYLNNGQGVFNKAHIIALTGQSYMAIGDVNGDGKADLVSGGGDIALGDGNGKFQAAESYTVAAQEGAGLPVLADLTGSGQLDVVVGTQAAISVLLHKSKAKFEDGVWVSLPGAGSCAAAGDFNGDGKPDLAMPTSSGITILLGTGNANTPFTVGASLSLSGVGCPLAGDLNGDGILDLLVGANSANGVVAFLGNGDGTFREADTTPVSPGVLALGDFNHDGKLDFADSSNQMALGNGDGTFQSPTAIVADPPTGGYSWIATGDVNNDGWTDIVLTNWNIARAIYILRNNRAGGFDQETLSNDNGPVAVVLGDLNGDGNLDMVAEMFYLPDAVIYLGNGRGGFTMQKTTLPYTHGSDYPATIGDVNGDGIPDIILPVSGDVEIWLGAGDGTFPTSTVYGTGLGDSEILLQNLHGQSVGAGVPDIVAPDSSGGVTVLINTTK